MNQAEGPKVVRSREPIEMAGKLLADGISGVIGVRDFARVAVSGGPATGALGVARERLKEGGQSWRRLKLSFTDEACVPFADERSVRGRAYRLGDLDADHSPDVELPLFIDGESPLESLERVEASLDRDFDGRMDLNMLHLRADGSIAAVFPGRPMIEGRVAFVGDCPRPPARRITMTPRLLAGASTNLILALGEEKRPIIERILDGDGSLPTAALSGVIIVTDAIDAR